MVSTAFSTVNQFYNWRKKNSEKQPCPGFYFAGFSVGRDFRDPLYSITGRCLSNFNLKASNDWGLWPLPPEAAFPLLRHHRG